MNTFDILNRMTLHRELCHSACTVGGLSCQETSLPSFKVITPSTATTTKITKDDYYMDDMNNNNDSSKSSSVNKGGLSGHYICLGCLQVFCGRLLEGHAEEHYQQTKRDAINWEHSSPSVFLSTGEELYASHSKTSSASDKCSAASSSHCAVLSCDTLECWCYQCNAYVSSQWFEDNIVSAFKRACDDKCVSSVKQHGQLLNEKKTVKTERDKLYSDLKSCFESQLLCDVRFVWLDEDNGSCDTSTTCDSSGNAVRELMAHRMILALRCPVFLSMFTSNMRESQATIIDIVIHNYSYETFYAFINYLYTGMIEITTGNVVELLAISSEYMMNDLKDQCSSTILLQVGEDYASLCPMFDLVGKFDSSLEKHLMNLIANNAETVIQSPSFLELTEESVRLILCNKILAIESEVHLLRAVIAWGHFQLSGTVLNIKGVELENEEKYLSDEVLLKTKDLIGLIDFSALDTKYHNKLRAFADLNEGRTCLRTISFNQKPPTCRFSDDGWVIKHNATSWLSYPLPTIQLKGAQVFALSFTIDKCDHHRNIRIGLSTPTTRYWFYGYNGGLYSGSTQTGSTSNLKFGMGDRVTLIVDNKNQRMALLKDNSEQDEIFFSRYKLERAFTPFVELYSHEDSVRIHKNISPVVLQRIATQY